MPTWKLRRFCRPDTLRQIKPQNFLHFLEPHRRFFEARGVLLNPSTNLTEADYAALIEIFLSPDAQTPPDLIESLYLVDELSTKEGMLSLLSEIELRGLRVEIPQDDSHSDVAVRLWRLDPTILQRKHAEQRISTVRSFTSFQSKVAGRLNYSPPTDERLGAMAGELDDIFEKKKRGRATRVIMCRSIGDVWFLISHGESFQRAESVVRKQRTVITYRPLKHDIVVYSPVTEELRINARLDSDKQVYRRLFGNHLFGDPDTFPGIEKYNLAPLREAGSASLTCTDIDGIEDIKLVEIQLFFPGHPWEIVVRKSDDIFESFAARNQSFPEAGRLSRACFRLKFEKAKKPRTVVIKPPNVAQFVRDEDADMVEEWLTKRGFISDRKAQGHGRREPVLAGN
jgi:hypothetical protein